MAFGYLVLATLTALAALAALAVALRAELSGRAETVVATTMIWNAIVVAPIYVLGLTNHLGARTLAIVCTVWFTAVFAATFVRVDRRVFARRIGRALIDSLRLPFDALREAVRARSLVAVGHVLALAAIVWTIAMSWYCPNWGQWDALWYHEPMIGFTLQNHGFAMVDLPMTLQKINGYPRLCEMTQLWFVVFTDRRLVEVVNSLVAPALVLSVYLLASRYTRDRVAAAGWGVALFLPPFVSNLLATQYVDMHYAAFVLAAVHFATRPTLRVRDALLASICLALAIGSKSMALVPVGIVAPIALVRLIVSHGRRRTREVVAASIAGAGCIVGTAAETYWRNWKHFHNPFWPDLKVDIPKWGIHWPGVVEWGAGKYAAGNQRIDMNLPLGQFLGDLLAIPYSKTGSYVYQTFDYGFAVGWCVLPLAIIALVAITCAVVASWMFGLTRWSTWRAAPETTNALLVSLPAIAILETSPALWSARYNIAAVGIMMVLVAWLGGRKRFGRLGEGAVVFSALAGVVMFFWVKPRWIFTPTELSRLAHVPYPAREVTPVRDFAGEDVYLARGSAITRDVGLAREAEIGDGDVVAFDETYGGFPALFWNNRYSNRVVYLPDASTFVSDAEKLGAKWIYCSYSDWNLGRLREKDSGWQEIGTLNVEGWGAMFRRVAK